MGNSYEVEFWVEFLSDDAVSRAHNCVEQFESEAFEQFEKFAEENDFKDVNSDCDNIFWIAYLTFCDLVGHGTGFWCRADDYTDHTKELFLRFHKHLKTDCNEKVYSLAQEIDELMYLAQE